MDWNLEVMESEFGRYCSLVIRWVGGGEVGAFVAISELVFFVKYEEDLKLGLMCWWFGILPT